MENTVTIETSSADTVDGWRTVSVALGADGFAFGPDFAICDGDGMWLFNEQCGTNMEQLESAAKRYYQ